MTPKTINHSMTKYYTISILVWLRNWQECKINLTLNLLNEILLWYSDIIHSESEKKRQGFEIKSLDTVSQFRNRSRGFINCFGVHQAAFKVVMNHSENDCLPFSTALLRPNQLCYNSRSETGWLLSSGGQSHSPL